MSFNGAKKGFSIFLFEGEILPSSGDGNSWEIFSLFLLDVQFWKISLMKSFISENKKKIPGRFRREKKIPSKRGK